MGAWDDSNEFARETDYRRYKNFCNKPPPPTGDRCQDHRNKIKWRSQCINLRKKWDDLYWPGRHASDIAREERALRRDKRRYANAWECREDPPLICDE